MTPPKKQSPPPISSDVLRGHLEGIILTLIAEQDRYGYELAREIRTRTDDAFDMKEATLYSIIQRLEKKELITSYIGERSHGGKRRYYRLTPLGKAYLREKRNEWQTLKRLMAVFMEEST